MFNIGGGELLVIALIALIVLGPQRLPDAVRTVGRVVGEVRRISSGFQQELRDTFEDSDVAEEAKPPRRRESVPLAATVADATPDSDKDADTDADTRTDSDPGPVDTTAAPAPPSGDGVRAESPHDAGNGTSVAPVIAEALDAIVPPDDPPAADLPAVGPPGRDEAPPAGERAAS
jgi:sec-independent protein translocase protein TatB